MERRVVVTGMGGVASNGVGVSEIFEGCLEARSRCERIPDKWKDYSGFGCDIWSPLDEPDYSKWGITDIDVKQLDHSTLIALHSAFEALSDSGYAYKLIDAKYNKYEVDGIDPYRTGVILGTGIGGISSLVQAYAFRMLSGSRSMIDASLERAGDMRDVMEKVSSRMLLPRRFNPFSVPMIMQNAAAANIGIKFGFKGINRTVSAACASGTAAIGNAYEAVKSGRLDAALTGGVEYLYDEYGGLFYGFDILKTLCKPLENIEQSNRPFDRDRSGFLYSQGGAGVLIIEELETAVRRGAKIYAEILSFHENNDASNIMMLDNSGEAIERMVRTAVDDAGIKPEDIDYINAHGTGTLLNDEVESGVIERVFGKNVYVNSTKSILGHSLGASGALEAIVTILSMHKGVLHPNKNLVNPVRDLNFVMNRHETNIKTALTESFGFGGHNSCLVLRNFGS